MLGEKKSVKIRWSPEMDCFAGTHAINGIYFSTDEVYSYWTPRNNPGVSDNKQWRDVVWSPKLSCFAFASRESNLETVAITHNPKPFKNLCLST